MTVLSPAAGGVSGPPQPTIPAVSTNAKVSANILKKFFFIMFPPMVYFLFAVHYFSPIVQLTYIRTLIILSFRQKDNFTFQPMYIKNPPCYIMIPLPPHFANPSHKKKPARRCALPVEQQR
jgi:hypothetical protein